MILNLDYKDIEKLTVNDLITELSKIDGNSKVRACSHGNVFIYDRENKFGKQELIIESE